MIKFAPIFTDHAVLQRGKNVRIWGESDARVVTLSLYMSGESGSEPLWEISCEVTCGHFACELPPREAGGPYEIVLSTDAEQVKISDVYFGEVWIAGGQSNMELELQNSLNGREVLQSLSPEVRYFYVPKIAWDGPELAEALEGTEWQESTSEYAKAWSAVAYHFAASIAKDLQCKVGIIGCNWGGTSASCWMSREYLEKEPSLRPYLERYDQAVAGQTLEEYLIAWENYNQYQAEFDKNVGHYYQTNPNPSWEEAISLFGENQYPGPLGPRNWTRPYGLYECMLKKVAPYTLAGALFYQGEDDDNRPYTYETLLRTMIAQWRADFQDEKLPFMLVQLPRFLNEGEEDDKNWPFIREAQNHIADADSQVGLAVSLEVGEYHNIHPLDKKTVGDRLALQAKYLVYHLVEEEQAFGPRFCSMSTEEGRIRISLSYAKDGLEISQEGRETDSSAWGFEVASEDGQYYPATVKLEADGTLLLESKEVACPVEARYYWTNYAPVYVYGKNGIPLAPFRTNPLDGARAVGSRQGDLYS